MKVFLKKFKNKIKKLISLKKINPHKHWKILLHVFFIVITLLILFSFYLLYKIKNQQIFKINPESNEATILIDKKLLKKVEESFDKKSTKVQEIKEGLKKYEDPSLN